MINESKYAEEKRFWKAEIQMYVRWYSGNIRELYGIPKPSDVQKIRHHRTIEQNAIATWIEADRWRYCRHLMVEPTRFSGKSVLEIGCGPLWLSRFFVGAKIFGLDPLFEWYRECGYPSDHGCTELHCTAEDIHASDDEFDVVVSVNAIDHVDDFEKSISECERVCHPYGEIRLEVHYHAPTVTEPNVLNDERVSGAFRKFSMKKIAESPSSRFYPVGTHPHHDRFALWSNRVEETTIYPPEAFR